MSGHEPGWVTINADLFTLLRSAGGKIACRIEEVERGHETPCWITDYCRNDGYATVKFDGRMQKAHRVVYALIIGPLSPDAVLDHRCRVRECINPRHLEPVTRRENTIRGEGVTALNARATHCSKGHEFSPENTVRRSDGGRRCRICQTETWSQSNARRRTTA